MGLLTDMYVLPGGERVVGEQRPIQRGVCEGNQRVFEAPESVED